MQLFRITVKEFGNAVVLQGIRKVRDAGPALLIVDDSMSEWADVETADALVLCSELINLGCISLAVVRSDVPPKGAVLDAFDLIATTGEDSDEEWVFAGDSDALNGWIEDLMRTVDHLGLAAVVAARLLRHTATMSVEAGLLAEATAYSMLQAGPVHQAWLRTRSPLPPGRSI
jgi:hypothetical protein